MSVQFRGTTVNQYVPSNAFTKINVIRHLYSWRTLLNSLTTKQ